MFSSRNIEYFCLRYQIYLNNIALNLSLLHILRYLIKLQLMYFTFNGSINQYFYASMHIIYICNEIVNWNKTDITYFEIHLCTAYKDFSYRICKKCV